MSAKTFYLWLEGEVDSRVHEAPGDSPETKYARAYEAAIERGSCCAITDETGLGDQQSGPLIATVHLDGEVTDGAGVHLFKIENRIPSLQKSQVKVVVVCANAQGSPDLYTYTADVTKVQVQHGVHYD